MKSKIVLLVLFVIILILIGLIIYFSIDTFNKLDYISQQLNDMNKVLIKLESIY